MELFHMTRGAVENTSGKDARGGDELSGWRAVKGGKDGAGGGGMTIEEILLASIGLLPRWAGLPLWILSLAHATSISVSVWSLAPQSCLASHFLPDFQIRRLAGLCNQATIPEMIHTLVVKGIGKCEP